MDLKIVDKWDGYAPAVIGSGGSTILPLSDLQRPPPAKSNTDATHSTTTPPAGRRNTR